MAISNFKNNVTFLFANTSDRIKSKLEAKAFELGYTSFQPFLAETAYIFLNYPSLFPRLRNSNEAKLINNVSFYSKKYTFIIDLFNHHAEKRDIPPTNLFNEFIDRLYLLVESNSILHLPPFIKPYLDDSAQGIELLRNLRKSKNVLVFYNLVAFLNSTQKSKQQISYHKLNSLLLIGHNGYDKKYIKQYTNAALKGFKLVMGWKFDFEYGQNNVTIDIIIPNNPITKEVESLILN